MSNPARPPERVHEFTLRSRPPVRSFVMAALYALVGAALVVLSQVEGWPLVVTVAGALLLLLGLVVTGFAVLALNRLRTRLLLEPRTLTLVSGRRRTVLGWSEISGVGLDDTRLVFRGREGGRDEVVPYDRSRTDRAAFADLVAALQSYLDASRGYRD